MLALYQGVVTAKVTERVLELVDTKEWQLLRKRHAIEEGILDLIERLGRRVSSAEFPDRQPSRFGHARPARWMKDALGLSVVGESNM